MSLKKKLKIAVIGATGYTGLDLIYLLSKHPKVHLLNLCAKKSVGKDISSFDKRIKKNKFPKISKLNSIDWKKLDLVFLSLPNGEAQKIIKKTFHKYENLKYIDLSADFRITNPLIYKKNYQRKHLAKNLIKHALYSITEISKNEINKYRIIANPGCYPTSIQIPLIPIINKKLIMTDNITIDSKSGYSGAGKNFKRKFKHKNFYQSSFAYSTKFHRHISEIDQEILKHTKQKINFTFNPHLLPTFRGMISSIYLNLKKKINAQNVRDKLFKVYKRSKFVKVLKLNTQIGSGNVLNTNNCEISICETRIKNKIVIFSIIDNLVKGASGQAIQNMNILYNYSEKLGLK